MLNLELLKELKEEVGQVGGALGQRKRREDQAMLKPVINELVSTGVYFGKLSVISSISMSFAGGDCC